MLRRQPARGVSVMAIDLFADRDLHAVCLQAQRLDASDYPAGFLRLVAGMPAAPVAYCGGLENHPELIRQLAATRPLAGNGAAQVACVRTPERLADVVRRVGCRFPMTVRDPVEVPADGAFLCKPLASAGGQGVVHWYGQSAPMRSGGWCWQRCISGQLLSVSLVLAPGQVDLLGICRQVTGYRGVAGGRFRFRGAIELPPAWVARHCGLVERLKELGTLLASEAGLVGLVGIDFMLSRTGRDEIPVVLEVNPRPTASMELIERRVGWSLAVRHLAACGLPIPAAQTLLPVATGSTWAKEIVVARQAGTIPATWDQQVEAALVETRTAAEGDWPLLADRPVAGTQVKAGQPVVTVFAAAQTPAEAFRRVRCRAQRIAAAVPKVCGRPAVES